MIRKQIARVVVASSMFALPAFADDIPAEEEVTASDEVATVDGEGQPAPDIPTNTSAPPEGAEGQLE